MDVTQHLKLNCSKTEIVLFGAPINVSKCKDFKLSVDNTQMSLSGLDAQLAFNSHFKNTTKIIIMHILDHFSLGLMQIIHAFITSHAFF